MTLTFIVLFDKRVEIGFEFGLGLWPYLNDRVLRTLSRHTKDKSQDVRSIGLKFQPLEAGTDKHVTSATHAGGKISLLCIANYLTINHLGKFILKMALMNLWTYYSLSPTGWSCMRYVVPSVWLFCFFWVVDPLRVSEIGSPSSDSNALFLQVDLKRYPL